MSHFKGHFEGSKSQGPLKMSREMAHKVIVPKKNLKQGDIGNFMSFCNNGLSIMSRSFLNLIN
jgi:hypothetical protein